MDARSVGAGLWSALILVFVVSATAQELDVFGSGPNTFAIEFLTIGHPGNPADVDGDPSPAGAVEYVFRIGKYELAEEQVVRAIAAGGLDITNPARGPNKPAMGFSWLEAAILVNWLNTSTGHYPAYKLIPPVPPFHDPTFHLWEPHEPGYDPANPYRNRLAKYVIPSADEWYKAAYFDAQSGVYREFPTGRDRAPEPVASGSDANTAVFNQLHAADPADVTLAGGLSPYGSMGQGGNAFEWNESPYFFDYSDPHAVRIVRGGDFSSYAGGANDLRRTVRDGWTIWGGGSTWGLRVAAVTPDAPTGIGDAGDLRRFTLHGVHPIPAATKVTFSVHLHGPQGVSARVFDVRGRLVDTAFAGMLAPGTHELSWDPAAQSVAAGTYFLRVESATEIQTRRFVIVR